ncbi:MAG TPA: formylglycine-generating enzyme family protein [Phototrophicaceae bacterium]|nr:formylglycine-generating enzyme family protein [Phototrophicaceae bacterium]
MGGETDHRQLMADFDALQLTAGYAKTGSCFVYQLDKSTSPLPNVCNQATLVFRRSVLPTEVVWYTRAFDQSPTLVVIGGGTDALGVFCPEGNPDCPLVWEVTPSPMRSSPETPVISPTATTTPTLPATVTPILPAALELARTPVLHNADWTPITHTFDGVEMVLVPMGCFSMGNDSEPYYWNDKARRWVGGVPDGGQQCFEEPFWLDKTEVTNAQYKLCVDAGACTPPGDRTDYDDAAYADHPVVYVDWTQAQTYAEWRGGRLPTEREWEYAARGPDALFFPWGNEFDGTRLNYCDQNCPYDSRDKAVDDGYSTTAPVGSYPGGSSWVGARDLSGNVWEWTNSVYVSYPYDKDDGREDVGRADVMVAVRGGAFLNFYIEARAAIRYLYLPGSGNDYFGFRVVDVSS